MNIQEEPTDEHEDQAPLLLDELLDLLEELGHQLAALREPLAEQAVRVHLHQLRLRVPGAGRDVSE